MQLERHLLPQLLRCVFEGAAQLVQKQVLLLHARFGLLLCTLNRGQQPLQLCPFQVARLVLALRSVLLLLLLLLLD